MCSETDMQTWKHTRGQRKYKKQSTTKERSQEVKDRLDGGRQGNAKGYTDGDYNKKYMLGLRS